MLRRYTWGIPLLTLAFLAIMALTISVVWAQSTSSGPDGIGSSQHMTQVDESSGNDAELEDLQFVATETGISLQEAIDRYGWNDDFAQAIANVRAKSPEAFAGAKITGDTDAWVAFADQTPEAAQKIINAFGASYPGVSVEIHTNRGFTEDELEKAIAVAHFAVFESADVLDAATSFDYDTNQINVTARMDNIPLDPALNDLREKAENNVTNATRVDILDAIMVHITVVRHDLGSNHSSTKHMGGEDLGSCTSGFGTIAPSGVRGIATAGHCGDYLTDDGHNLKFRSEHVGTYGDFQWHTGPVIEGNDFYSGDSDNTETYSRPVESVGSPVKGQWLCKNGLITHKDCQKVRKVSVCKGGVCNLALFEGTETSKGDSGGPIYWGRAAYGFHRGRAFDSFFGRDMWSRADLIDEALGLNIATD